MKVNTEFRKGIMFIRVSGSLTKDNISFLKYEDFKYVVFNFDNLLSIDSYAIKYIINYNTKIKKDNGKLVICDGKKNMVKNLFKGIIPVIYDELEAFNSV